MDFELPKPDPMTGQCDPSQALEISTSPDQPKFLLCGTNTKTHLYLPVMHEDQKFFFRVRNDADRAPLNFNIKITQVQAWYNITIFMVKSCSMLFVVFAGLRLNNAWASGTVLRPFLQPESPLSSRSLVSGFKCKLGDLNSRPQYSRPRALTTRPYTIPKTVVYIV